MNPIWAWTILLLPLGTFIIQAALGRKLPRGGDWLATLIMGLAFLLSSVLLFQVWNGQIITDSFSWLSLPILDSRSPAIDFQLGIRVDTLAALMLCLVSLISLCVHIFSISYMHGDENYPRYWAFLGLFCFSMLGIVMADSLLFIFMCWELVGLSSYFLIGFWHKKKGPAYASQKAFIINRIGDVGFLIGILIMFTQSGTLNLSALEDFFTQSQIANGQWVGNLTLVDGVTISRSLSEGWINVSGICLLLGCIGKSAQFPLQVWLPDAMEGPTPVSALIHAATMVAAGVYLLARIFIFLSPVVLTIIAFVGAITALMAGIAAMTQWDIKRVLAYSTISQLGYMVTGIGVGAWDMALLHLFTHAFFKAALFLGAGAIIHALHEQDIRKMGNLRKHMPKTFVLYLIPMLALSGLPFFTGFLSKDGILLGAVSWAQEISGLAWLVPILGFITAGLTAFYMARQMVWIFGGETKSENAHVHDPGWLMLGPLIVLALGSFWFAFSWNPLDATSGWVMDALAIPNSVIPGVEFAITPDHGGHMWVAILSIILAITGLFLGYRFHRDRKESTSVNFWQQLSFHHFYQDQLYEGFIAKGFLWFSKALSWFDSQIVDGIVRGIGWLTVHQHRQFTSASLLAAKIDDQIVDGIVRVIARITAQLGQMFRNLQAGELQRYLLYVVLTVLAVGAFIYWDVI